MPDLREKLGGAPHSKQSLRLWLRLLSCATVIEKRLRTRLAREFHTTLPRFDVLAALERHPDGLTMGELSHALMVSNGNVTGVANRLLADGLIEREVDARDRRTFRVRLSRKGREEFATMAKVHEGWVDDMFADLTNEEIETLMEQLIRVRRSVAQSEKRAADA
ncbi:MAG: MarR family transcriptional regulator [Alphaproteobacteria bacterium]|nr:MAG: MarR family transcriptional regulator [Alphaproteobacteria bacterium]